MTTWRRQAPVYYVRLAGGLYLAEVASVLLLFVPRPGWLALARRLDSPSTVSAQLFETVAARRLPAFRVDATLILLVYAAAFVAYGPHWWMLLAALGGRSSCPWRTTRTTTGPSWTRRSRR